MKQTSIKIVSAAKQAALAQLNTARAADGLPPLKRVTNIWWAIHGEACIRNVERSIAKPVSAVTRINKALKALGREERLVRGRGYYYLIEGESSSFYTSSIYTMWIEPKDFAFAASEVNDMFRRAGIEARIEIPQADIDLDVQNRAIIMREIAADKARKGAK